jgi:hypothetical protein
LSRKEGTGLFYGKEGIEVESRDLRVSFMDLFRPMDSFSIAATVSDEATFHKFAGRR